MISTSETIRVLVETPEIRSVQGAARAVDLDRETRLVQVVVREDSDRAADLDKAARVASDKVARVDSVRATDLVKAMVLDRVTASDRATGSVRAAASDKAVDLVTIYLIVAIRLVGQRLITIHNLSSTNLITWTKP